MPDVFNPDIVVSSPKNGGAPVIINSETNLFDIEDIYPNCPAQVIRNSVIGKVGVGWRKNGE